MSSIKLAIKQGRDRADDDFGAGEDSAGDDRPDETAANFDPADGKAN